MLQDGKAFGPQPGDAGYALSPWNGRKKATSVVDSARMYSLVDNHDFGEHELELRCAPGVAAFAFTFTSCVDPVASALQADSLAELMKRVVAGLIVKDGKLLVCQRTRHQTMPLKWEFPGGKIEEGEQPRDALRRELEEELGIPANDRRRNRPDSA